MKRKHFSIPSVASSLFKFPVLKSFKFKIVVLHLFLIGFFPKTQTNIFGQDSSHIRISLLTCTPGAELYSTFGHTAIRVTDSSSVTDNVFNYGTFNFEDPGFYTKFVRGKLLYYLSVENFQEFKYAYQAENRGITEQVLNLNAAEKIALMEALYENAKDQYKFYQYDFFFDNCTTRPRDMLLKFKKNPPAFNPVMPKGTRFRQAIHQYLDMNEKYWSKLGIDLLLGAPTDAVMTTAQSQFLPDNLMKSLDSSNHQHQFVLSKTNLYPINQELNKGEGFLTPMLAFSLLLTIVILLQFSNNNTAKICLQCFDGIFFFLTGVIGMLLIFMWVGTDHSMTKNNYNLIWAWPWNIIIAFFVNSKKKWVGYYFGISTAALLLVLISWFFLPQQMNNAFIPIVLIMATRSAYKYLSTRSYNL